MSRFITLLLLGISFTISFGAMAAEEGADMHGFKLLRQETIKEISAVARLYQHQKTGAELLYVSTDDDNKVFNIMFKTPPQDSTGLPHILEHSVLCGSRKFPSKEPFLELVKGSLKTFVNAMTWPDKTVYPVASRNDKDFVNLMDVYLDAVFFPNIYKDPLILKQEGWRLELNEKTGALEYNGVVYNEMKGVFSSPDAVMERKTYHALFPEGTYTHESGGEPAEIPGLTQQMFTEFHQKHYHPSNALIFFYGNGKIEEHLKFINDEYLSQFEKKKVDVKIALPKKPPRPVELTEYYSVNAGDSLKDKSFLSQAYGIGASTDPELVLGMEILASILLQTEASPLKRALVEAGIGQDVGGDFDASILKPMLTIYAKKTEARKKDEFKAIIQKTLKALVKKGLDPKLIEASINRKEFQLREMEFRRYPKGLVLSGWAAESWLYGGDPLAHLKFDPVLEKIKKLAGKRYFEKLIEKQILNNPHRVVMVLKPQKGLDEKRAEKLKAKLAKLKKSLKPEALAEIKTIAAALKTKQQTPDRPEALAKIPMLEIKDVDKKAEVLPLKKVSFEGTEFWLHSLKTNKIGYVTFYFDSTVLPQELIPYASLLDQMLGKVDTEKYSFADLNVEINTHLGALDFGAAVYPKKDSVNQIVPLFVVKAKALLPKFTKLFALVEEVALRSKFDNKARLREIIQENKAGLEQGLIMAGDHYGSQRVTSYFSAHGRYQETVGGVEYYRFLSALDADFDKVAPALIENLKKVAKLVFNRQKLVVSFTGENADFEALKPGFRALLANFGAQELPRYAFDFKPGAANEGLIIPSKVQYVVQGGNFRDAGKDYSGSLQVVKNVLSRDYLWNRVRVQSGAYGASADISRTGTVVFASYRDPNLKETYDNYEKSVSYLKSFDVSDREMTKLVLGTVSQLDMPLTPSQKGDYSDMHTIIGLSQDEIQELRDDVLATRQKEIRKQAEVIEAVLKQGYRVTVGSEAKINENKDRFKKIINVIK